MATIRRRRTKYQVQIRRKGSSLLSRSFTSLKDAQTWAKITEIQIERRELPQGRKVLDGTILGDLVKRYRDTVCPRKRGAGEYETAILNAFLRHPLASKRLSEITQGDFASYRDERIKEIKPSSLRRQLNPLSNLFEIAKDEWGLPVENYISKLRLPESDAARERRLRTGELEALLRATSPTLSAIIRFAVHTGMRRGEILAMQWDHYDQGNRCLLIPRSKNGRARIIPLSKAADTVLTNELCLLYGVTPLQSVFPIELEAFKSAWQRAIERSGIDDLQFHDLRHEAISRFFELGLSVPEVALISGHRDMRMLFRYTHAQREKIAEKLNV